MPQSYDKPGAVIEPTAPSLRQKLGYVPVQSVKGDSAGTPGLSVSGNTQVTLSFDPSLALDDIGATEGDILFRGAAAWQALGPGTAGDVLQTNGPGADPSWVPPPGGSGITQLTGDVTAGPGTGSQVATLSATGVTAGTYGDATHVAQVTVDAKGRLSTVANVAISGGGGGYVGPRQGSVTKPSLASFTQVNFNAPHTVAADGVAGITLYDDTAVTGWRLLEESSPATPFDIYAHFGYGTGANNHKCLTLRDTTNGRLIGVGRYEAQTIVTVWNSVTSFAANRVLANGPGMDWVRMHNDGTTITCYLSSNGLDWFKVWAETIASFLTGPMDKMGFGIQMDAGTNGILCDSFSTVAPT